jgi:CHAT domain-containing protein
VPTTVVSQWKVEAASSTGLLVEFYRAMKKSPNPAAALRSAALAVKADKQYEHPFYWASFILVGRDGL